MRLTDLDPHWLTCAPGRSGMGISFECPRCRDQRLGVWFKNPLDGGPPAPPEEGPKPRWVRTGDTFETLTLTPSIDASCCTGCVLGPDGKPTGHWHGYITDGSIR
jgi:hypothetical protein